MKKLIALSALSTVLCVASIGAFAQTPANNAVPSATTKHHHKHHKHHHAKSAASTAH